MPQIKSPTDDSKNCFEKDQGPMNSKTFVIVGGSSGIGFEIARTLSLNGDKVIAFSRSAKTAGHLEGVAHGALDISIDDISAEMVPEKTDGLVYCPGSIQLRPFSRLNADDFLADFRINLLGAVKAIHAFLPSLKRADQGASIVLFSTVAVQTGMPFHASIASAKGAVEGLTRSLAAELAPKIRVNAIAPSLTDTPLAAQLISDETKRKAAAERHPLKRIGSPEDIAEAAVFLLGETASWITGQIIHVDGGMGSVRTFK
jgi:NAD(P)-dependent dehydrogenase (short-subunit alcohol dehydrogenase family)